MAAARQDDPLAPLQCTPNSVCRRRCARGVPPTNGACVHSVVVSCRLLLRLKCAIRVRVHSARKRTSSDSLAALVLNHCVSHRDACALKARQERPTQRRGSNDLSTRSVQRANAPRDRRRAPRHLHAVQLFNLLWAHRHGAECHAGRHVFFDYRHLHRPLAGASLSHVQMTTK